ncbi:MAG: DUF294 nucleotidyltransferase-like domain-containing protein [Polaromonas sp.]
MKKNPVSALPALEFLSHHRVFRQVPHDALATLASHCQWTGFAAGAMVLAQGQVPDQLVLVVSGTVNLQDTDAGWTVALQTGDYFGAGVTPVFQQASWQAVAATNVSLAILPADALNALCRHQPELVVFFPSLPAFSGEAPSGSPALPEQAGEPGLLGTPIRLLIRREAVTLPPATPIRAAAALMQSQRVSSVLLVENGQLCGLVTDRDLRNRVLAQGLDTGRPVADIATLAPLTLDAASPAFEALLLMARHNIHHVPVMDGQRLAGMLTATDLAEQHSTSAVYLVGDIHQQTDVEGLARISTRIQRLQQHLAGANASAYSTGHIVTAITDALTTRLIHLAEAKLGPAPIDYVWVAAGSQARSEQTARSDQDNCLVLDDRYDEAAHGDYFRTFSRFVCDGLAACGYIHCPGEMMAMTDTWRQPRRRWMQYFEQWVQQPEPKSLMLTCVFFDQRAIHGKAELLDTLRQGVLQRTRGNSLFLAYMVSNALKHRPPLGLFGNIALIRGGDNARTLDLKHSAIVPIVDLARVYALAGGLQAVNTSDRLAQVAEAGEVSLQGARDLRHALEFLSKLRIDHQSRQTLRGQAPDNFLALEDLSNFQRSQLKDAFLVVQTLQGVLAQRYQSGRF